VADRAGDDGEGTMIPVKFKIDDTNDNTSILCSLGPTTPSTWLGWKLLKLRVFGYRMPTHGWSFGAKPGSTNDTDQPPPRARAAGPAGDRVSAGAVSPLN
jgi:hypothetical protein